MKSGLFNLLTVLSLVACAALAAVRVRVWLRGDWSVPLHTTPGGTYVAKFGSRDVRVLSVHAFDPKPPRRVLAKPPPRPARVILDVPYRLLAAFSTVLPGIWFGRWLRQRWRNGRYDVEGSGRREEDDATTSTSA